MSKLTEDAKVSMDNLAQAPDVKEFIDMDQVSKDLVIDPNNIENSLYSVASLYARYAHLVTKARVQRDGFKSRAKLVRAKVEKEIRDKAATEGEKLTNPQVESLVSANGVVVTAELALNEAQAVLTACQETMQAISMKRDMLVQLNKNQNREFQASSGRVGTGDKPTTPAAPQAPDLSDVL